MRSILLALARVPRSLQWLRLGRRSWLGRGSARPPIPLRGSHWTRPTVGAFEPARSAPPCAAHGDTARHEALAGAALTRAVWAAVILVFLLTLPAMAAQVSDEEVREIASQLRCVVCQNLSVADSPSETASQMRQIIRERLARGESREQILDYFVSKYGEWILLSPPRRGFNLVVWGLPWVSVLVGLVAIGVVVRRWSRSRRDEPPEAMDPVYRERVRQELRDLEP